LVKIIKGLPINKVDKFAAGFLSTDEAKFFVMLCALRKILTKYGGKNTREMSSLFIGSP